MRRHPSDRERDANARRVRNLESAIFRQAARDLEDDDWWEARLAKPLVRVAKPIQFSDDQLIDF